MHKSSFRRGLFYQDCLATFISMEHAGRHHSYNNLKKYRRLSLYSRKKAARVLAVDASELTRWENGTIFPSLENLFKLSVLYSKPAEVLFSEKYKAVKETLKVKKG